MAKATFIMQANNMQVSKHVWYATVCHEVPRFTINLDERASDRRSNLNVAQLVVNRNMIQLKHRKVAGSTLELMHFDNNFIVSLNSCDNSISFLLI
jgi:hypothetical protein